MQIVGFSHDAAHISSKWFDYIKRMIVLSKYTAVTVSVMLISVQIYQNNIDQFLKTTYRVTKTEWPNTV